MDPKKLNEKRFLEKGLFEAKFMQSRVTTNTMTFKEKILGYILGPLGVTVYYQIVNQLKELYYTSVIPFDSLFGTGTYMGLTITTTIIGFVFGLVLAWMIERTVSSAGKIRPYVFMGSALMLVSGICVFWSPFARGSGAQLVWFYIMNVLFTSFGVLMWNKRLTMLSLSTRNQRDRTNITTINYGVSAMVSGLFGGIIVSSILYYRVLYHDSVGTEWIKLIATFAAVGVPLMLLEYLYTKERITEEYRELDTLIREETEKRSVPQEIKAMLTNKYYVIALVMSLLFSITLTLQGVNVRTNYCQWILGASSENNIQILYMTVAMAPMGFGILLITPLASKFGARKVNIVCDILIALGVAICYTDLNSMMIAMGGAILLNFGMLAPQYVAPVFQMQGYDMVEYKNGFRPEGTMALGIITAFSTIITSPISGLYETVLMALGYDAYATAQSGAVSQWICFCWLGLPGICALLRAVLLFFFDAEKHIPEAHRVIHQRMKDAAEAKGETWLSPEEREEIGKAENARIAEEERIASLKEKCAKKGLDFEAENQKYLDKIAAEKAKKEAKLAKKRSKAGKEQK